MKLTYGIPLWLMKKYLADLGATETEENVLVTDHWRAVVSEGEPMKICSLVVGRIEVDISGDEAAIEAMLGELYWKTLRSGA